MKRVIGIDIGNSSTEVALVEIDNHQQVRFLESAIAETTGIKVYLVSIRRSMRLALKII